MPMPAKARLSAQISAAAFSSEPLDPLLLLPPLPEPPVELGSLAGAVGVKTDGETHALAPEAADSVDWELTVPLPLKLHA